MAFHSKEGSGGSLCDPEGFSKPSLCSSSGSLTSLGMGFQKDKRITATCYGESTPNLPPRLQEVLHQMWSLGEKQPATRPRPPSSSPSQIPALPSPGPACINYFYASHLLKGQRFTNFRDFDLKMQAVLLHAKALASDCVSKINGSKGKKKPPTKPKKPDALSRRMGAKSFFTRVSTRGQRLFKGPLGRSLFFHQSVSLPGPRSFTQ